MKDTNAVCINIRLVILGGKMEEVKLSAKYKQLRDINEIEPDFIETVLFKMKDTIGFAVRTVAKSEKSFDVEPLIALKALVEYKEKEFSIAIERTTYEKTFLINIVINTESENELFKNLYNFKVEVVLFLKQFFGEVYYLQDSSNQRICADLYNRIHDVENGFRQMITIFYIRRIGRYDFTKSLVDSANDYSAWFNSKYRTSPFRRIENPLFNLTTERLFEVLERHLFDIECTEKEKLNETVDKLNELLDDLNWATEFTISTMKLNDFRKKFDGEFKKYKDKTIFELYFKDTLKEDFKVKWKEFSKMRNMVAHNKPICKELYDDIIIACEEIKGRINDAKESLDHFIPDEVIMVDALYEQQREELEAEANEIEFQREMSGIDPVWDEDTVIELLGESKPIQNLMSILDKYGDNYRLIEDYNDTCGSIEEKISDLDIDTLNEIKIELEQELNTDIEIDEDLDEEDTINDTIAGIMKALNERLLDIEKVYSDIDESKILDYFTMDEPLALFKDISGNEFTIYMDGTINPDHNYEEDIEVHLRRNNEVIMRGSININYGGFDDYDYSENQADNPYEADISPRLDKFNSEVESIIQDIIFSLDERVQRLHKVESIVERKRLEHNLL